MPGTDRLFLEPGEQGSQVLYEIHGPISGATGLQWYIGPGAHIGFYNTKFGDGSIYRYGWGTWALIINSTALLSICHWTGNLLLNLEITVVLWAAGVD